MMILAGVDEAGLGPTIGPLVTAASGLAVPAAWLPEEPWTRLADAVCRAWRKGETRPAVADSKVVYAAGGRDALELTVGAFAVVVGSPVLAEPPAAEGCHPCYRWDMADFPAGCAPEVLAAAERIRDALAAHGAAAVHFEAAAVHEPVLNRRFASGINKNQALLLETGRHLVRLVAKFPDAPMLVVVDKQGGRDDYLPFLMALFPGAWLDVVECGRNRSTYRLRRTGGDVEFRFQPKADRDSFTTALASLAAKYVRERAMAELNAWFARRVTGVKATAGYPPDARRWLAQVRALGRRKTLHLDRLVRQR
ncbi:MAG: hypothetical protein LIP77_03345 [Planctomycetes bacterium]|nr:hypothetical protein [Planctomycetota bacterium]